jgi:pimeloyl-ACP methyl ester carboxylesterase
MVSVRVLGSEMAAIGRAAVWLSARFGEAQGRFDPTVPHPTPLVFVHGLLGDRTNFRGIRRASSFMTSRTSPTSSTARLDWPRLATRLGRALDGLRREAGVRWIDVVRRSLGGLVAVIWSTWEWAHRSAGW